MACLVPTAIIGAGWCAFAWRVPEAAVTHLRDSVHESLGPVLLGLVFAFGLTWLLFVVMHRVSNMNGGWCPVIVVALVLLVIVAKQMVLAASGVRLPRELDIGWGWLHPFAIAKANVGAWLGIIAAVAMFRSGESFVDMFR